LTASVSFAQDNFHIAPRESNRVAHVCLRSCQRISGKPVRHSKGLKYLFTVFYAYSVMNTEGRLDAFSVLCTRRLVGRIVRLSN
jgi:hypothetical protein